MSVIGLDIGTTGCKAIIFSDQWEILGQASREYPIQTPQPTWYEQDAELVWSKTMDGLAEAIAQNQGDSPRAMALSVQGEATIAVNQQGKPIRPAILGMDTRTVPENQWLADQFGAEALFQRTGIPMHTMNTITKLLWLRDHEPKLWQTADQFLLYEDFFMRRLGGKACISPCLASRTQMLDLETRDWMHDVLDICHIDITRLAQLSPPQGGQISVLKQDVARQLGLNQSVRLISGGHDQACAALGSGIVQPGSAMVSSGTAEVIEVAMSTPTLDDTLRQGGISVYQHVVPNLYLAMTLNHSGGLCLRWFRDILCQNKYQQALATGQDAYDLILRNAKEGPTDLLVLPHFSGAGTPLLDTTSKAAILGLTFATTQAEIAKAILEGLTFEFKMNLDLLHFTGIKIHELHTVGGGSKSPLWLQLKADIGQLPLRVPRVKEAACLGAAILASVGCGTYADAASAAADAVQFDRNIKPAETNKHAYEKRFSLYKELYPLLINTLRQC